MIQIDANKKHPGYTMRLALSLSILTQTPITIDNFRTTDENPGLNHCDHFYAKILEQIGGAETKGIEKNSTHVEFIPTTIKGGPQINMKAPSLTSTILPNLLLVYHNTNQNIAIIGPTHVEGKITVDYFKTVIMPLLKKININARIDVTKRGHGKDIGKINLHTKYSNNLKPLELIKKGDLERINLNVYSYGHNELQNSYILEGIRNTISKQNIIIKNITNNYVENREKLKGYGAEVEIVYDNVTIGADVCSSTKQPTQLGKELGDKIISLLARETPFDNHSANILVPFLAFHKLKFKIAYPKKDEYMDDCIYVCETLLGTKFKKEEREKDILLESNY